MIKNWWLSEGLWVTLCEWGSVCQSFTVCIEMIKLIRYLIKSRFKVIPSNLHNTTRFHFLSWQEFKRQVVAPSGWIRSYSTKTLSSLHRCQWSLRPPFSLECVWCVSLDSPVQQPPSWQECRSLNFPMILCGSCLVKGTTADKNLSHCFSHIWEHHRSWLNDTLLLSSLLIWIPVFLLLLMMN